jgi:polar amino acid transport system substrate-binding protein
MGISKYIGAAISAALIAFSMGTAAQAKEWKTVRIGTEGAYPPFNELKPDGTLVGFDIDIAKALCDQMKVKCVFVTQDWDGMIPALLAGKFDAIIASMSITPEREKKVAFTNKYYNTPPAIAVPKDSDLKVATKGKNLDLAALDKALSGKMLGAQSATTHANYAQAHLPDAQMKLYPTADEYKLDLGSGRLDAAIDDIVVLSQWLNSPEGTCCKLLGTVPVDTKINGVGVGIALRKGDTDLKKMFNDAIVAIRKNGVYKKVNDKYFDFDVYGD